MELSAQNIKNYIGGPVKVNTMLYMLQDELDRGFITIYLEAMEARVRFDKDAIK